MFSPAIPPVMQAASDRGEQSAWQDRLADDAPSQEEVLADQESLAAGLEVDSVVDALDVEHQARHGIFRFLDQHDGGAKVNRDVTLNASGESPAKVVLDLEVGIGQVEVQDAAA